MALQQPARGETPATVCRAQGTSAASRTPRRGGPQDPADLTIVPARRRWQRGAALRGLLAAARDGAAGRGRCPRAPWLEPRRRPVGCRTADRDLTLGIRRSARV